VRQNHDRMDHPDRSGRRGPGLLRVLDDLKSGTSAERGTRTVSRPNPFDTPRYPTLSYSESGAGPPGEARSSQRSLAPLPILGTLPEVDPPWPPFRCPVRPSRRTISSRLCSVGPWSCIELGPRRASPRSSTEHRQRILGISPAREGDFPPAGFDGDGQCSLSPSGGAPEAHSRPVPDRSEGRAQRPDILAAFLAMKVTRVRRGDFLPSRNETRLAPVDFVALKFTRTRRGIFFLSRKETVSLRFAAIGAPSSARRVKRPLNPVQAKHYPYPPDGHHHGAHH